jgi:hypothetical protein
MRTVTAVSRGSIRGIGCADENDSLLYLVEVEADPGARVNRWHADRDQTCGVGFRPPRPFVPWKAQRPKP